MGTVSLLNGLKKPVHFFNYNCWAPSVILLQIIMVSPWTHLVKNSESQSITNEFLSKKK